MARISQACAKRLFAYEHALKGCGRSQADHGEPLAIIPTAQPRNSPLRRHRSNFRIVNYNRGISLKLAVVEDHRCQGLHLCQEREVVGRRVRDDSGIERRRTAQGANARQLSIAVRLDTNIEFYTTLLELRMEPFEEAGKHDLAEVIRPKNCELTALLAAPELAGRNTRTIPNLTHRIQHAFLRGLRNVALFGAAVCDDGDRRERDSRQCGDVFYRGHSHSPVCMARAGSTPRMQTILLKKS